jgi:hypothetical protein
MRCKAILQHPKAHCAADSGATRRRCPTAAAAGWLGRNRKCLECGEHSRNVAKRICSHLTAAAAAVAAAAGAAAVLGHASPMQTPRVHALPRQLVMPTAVFQELHAAARVGHSLKYRDALH